MTPVSMGALVLTVMGRLPVSVYQRMVATSVRTVRVDMDWVGPPSDDRQPSPDTPAVPLLWFQTLSDASQAGTSFRVSATDTSASV